MKARRVVVGGIAIVVAVLVVVCVVGLITTGLRLAVAGLPVGHGLFVVPFWHSVLTGVILTAIAAATLLVSCAAAYVAAWRRWDFHGQDWEDIVFKHGFGNAWTSLHAQDEKGRHRREARAARAEHVGSATRARRQRWLSVIAAALHLNRAAARRAQAAELHQHAADEQAAVVDEHERALGRQPVALRRTTAGDRLLRILAGFNIIVLAGVVGLGVGQIVAEFESAWWVVLLASLAAFALVHLLLTSVGPLSATPRGHLAAWVIVAAVAIICSPPVAVLIIAGVVISTWGRRLLGGRMTLPIRWLIRSPLPWLIAALYTVVGIGYLATPPVSFDAVTVTTASTEFIGGDLARSSSGIHLIVCTPLADATSTGAHLHEVSAKEIEGVTPGGQAALDLGERPSLPALVLDVVGIDWPPALVLPNLRARKPTCAGAPPPTLSAGLEDPSLGAGAIAGPAPPGGQAVDGEPPIEQTADPRIAALARRYQPTMEVTVADPFWPTSVGALLADIGPNGQRTCLSTASHPVCQPVQSLPATGTPNDYLRFPTTSNPAASALTQRPSAQFRAFEAGLHTVTGTLHHWLADPGILDPWRTAEIYFYYAGPVHFGGVAGQLPSWPVVALPATPQDVADASDGLIGLQYWFFYPYNYYPLVVRSSLMDGAPVIGDVENVDLHQGDWEHVTVLLDQRTLTPVALYTARHADEGVFIPWNSRALAFDQGHPIVQAAFGGHPSYPNTCGEKVRAKHGGGVLSDWVVCGSGRFAFRAATTPLVDLASPDTPWACWPGHFGEAKPGRETSTVTADTFDKALTHYVDVAGPRAPLRQAENGTPTSGVCTRGAGAAENDALQGPLAAVLTRLFGH